MGRSSPLALAIVAALGAAPACAAEWRVAEIAAAGITFIDVSATKRTDETVTFSTWTVRTSKAPNGIDNWKASSTANCASKVYRDLKIDYFAGKTFVEKDEAEPERTAVPDTMAFSKIAVACGTQKVSGEAVADPYEMAQDYGRRTRDSVIIDDAEPVETDPPV